MGVSGLGSLLVREGLLTETDRKTISGTCGQSSWAFAKTILAMGLLDEDELAAFFADHTRYLVADRNFIDQIDNAVLNQIDARMIARLEMLPVQSTANGATVAVVDPLDRGTIRQFEFFTGLEIEPIIAPVSQIYEGLTHLIDDFEPYDTNLQKFLKNHAATSWQRHYSVSGTLGAESSCFEIVLPEDTEIGVNFAIKAVFEGGDKPLMNIVEADGTNWGDTLALEGVAEMRGLYTNNLTVCLDDQSEAGADAEAVSFVFSVTAL